MGPQEIITFYCDFYCKEDLMSRLSCKIVSDYSDRALYFSRCVIPTSKDPDDNWRTPLGVFKKHIGIFVFPKTWLEMYGKNMWDDRKSILADTESLEQNRFLEFGSLVSLLKIKHVGFGIDIRDQIEILENRIKSLGIQT
jgi:CMP-2-keto-3-deoxyoctulosonic acid synthetase